MTDVEPAVPLAPSLGRPRFQSGDRVRRLIPVSALLLAGTLLVVVPLLALVRTSLEQGVGALVEAVLTAGPAISATLWTSVGATVLAVVVGTGLAIVTERTDAPGRRGLRVAMLIALIVPGYIAALGWLATYGPGGMLDDVFGIAVPALVGPFGIVVVMGVEAAPIVYLIVVAGLHTRVEPDLERAARNAGAGALRAFASVTLPLLRPVLAGAAAIGFVLSATSFGVPAVLGIPSGFTTMTTRIYRDLAFSSDPDSFVRALGLAIVLAVAAALAILVGDRLLERRSSERSGVFAGPTGQIAGSSMGPVTQGGTSRRVSPRTIVGAALAWVLVVVIVVLPLVGLLLTALTRAPGLAPVPANWTLANFEAVVNPRTLDALANSMLLAGAAAVGVAVLSLLAVVVRRRRGAGLTGGVLGLMFALPGSTLAIAVLLAYGVALRDTLLIILVAYLAKFWALGHRPVAAGLDGIPADSYRAARVSGAGAWTTTRTVVLPFLRPMIVAGALIVFMFGIHEITISSLLYGPGTATLAVVVLNLQQLGDTGATAALAILLGMVVALAALPLGLHKGTMSRLGWRG